MKKHLILISALLAVVACKEAPTTPRPALPEVYAIAADSAGMASLVAQSGLRNREGSIAIIGEPETAILLARRFQARDLVDNVDGRAVRDSLPDFAGETFDVLVDPVNAPYVRYWTAAQGLPDSLRHTVLDSLRAATLQNAVSAWDSLCWRGTTDTEPLLRKQRAKIVILTSALQTNWGKFDVDTLLEMCGAVCPVLSPVDAMLDESYSAGARSLVVWTSRDIRDSGAWQECFAQKQYPDAILSVIAPDPALDVRTEFRNLLRLLRQDGTPADALLLDSYSIDKAPLQSELSLIRQGGSEENSAFLQLLSPGFSIWDPASTLATVTYNTLRKNALFTHRVARPAVCYYETAESVDGTPMLVEISTAYAQRTYVPDFD